MDLFGIASVCSRLQAKPVGAKGVDAKAMAFVCTGPQADSVPGWLGG